MTVKLNNTVIITSATGITTEAQPMVFEVSTDGVRIENCIILSRERATQLGILSKLE